MDADSVAMVLQGSMRMPWDVLDDAQKMNPYEILGVSFLSSRDEIRKAYVRLCRREHPDLHGGHESMEWVMGEWAYRMLNDPQERYAYDTARVLRNALSVTEGIVVFGFSAVMNLGSFLADAFNIADRTMKEFMGGRQIENAKAAGSSRPSSVPAAGEKSKEKEGQEEGEVSKEEEREEREQQDSRRNGKRVGRAVAWNSRDQDGNYVPLMQRARRLSNQTASAPMETAEDKALKIAVAERRLAEGQARLRNLEEQEGEPGSLMADITGLRDDIAQLRQDITSLAKDASRAQTRLESLQEAEARL